VFRVLAARSPAPPTTVSTASTALELLCTGKVYFDLLRKRTELKRDDVAIVRIEQLYPFPEEARRYASAVWVQEEPLNMGAWTYIRAQFDNHMRSVARRESGSADAGSPATHKREQDDLLM
jgi:2-oxoglutarate dehydrogenase E1 component